MIITNEAVFFMYISIERAVYYSAYESPTLYSIFIRVRLKSIYGTENPCVDQRNQILVIGKSPSQLLQNNFYSRGFNFHVNLRNTNFANSKTR